MAKNFHMWQKRNYRFNKLVGFQIGKTSRNTNQDT